MASGMVGYWHSYNVTGDQFIPCLGSIFCCLSLHWGSKMRAKLKTYSELYIQQGRVYTLMPVFPAKYSFFHCPFWDRCPLLNLSLYQGGIEGLIACVTSMWIGVESSSKAYWLRMRRMWFSERKSGYDSQKNVKPTKKITCHRCNKDQLCCFLGPVPQADYLVIIRLCCVYDSELWNPCWSYLL